jgi:hypothetical protein
MQVSELSTRYMPIVNEITFHNAIAVLHTSTSPSDTRPMITLYLWSPKPEDAFFRQLRSPAFTDREVPGHALATKPVSPRPSSTPPLPLGSPPNQPHSASHNPSLTGTNVAPETSLPGRELPSSPGPSRSLPDSLESVTVLGECQCECHFLEHRPRD